MPRKFIQYLQGKNIYSCKKCGAHLTTLSQLISQAFKGKTGTAYLFNRCVNLREGKIQEKKLITGLHEVCDIFCINCNNQQPIGWKYVRTAEQSQKYKEGKIILEIEYLKRQCWTDQ